jgi:acetate kinase
MTVFRGIKIVAVSDSAFHRTMPVRYKYYGICPRIANRLGIKRYGYHGISLASIADSLSADRRYKKLQKVVVAHLGSGCSITAVNNWCSVNTSMGYSPLEGLMSSTRSGTIDVSAVAKLRRELNLSEAQVEMLLNKQSGLLAISEKSDDLRELLRLEKNGDVKAKLAINMWVAQVAAEVAVMTVSLGGCDALVFTGTVGQRSAVLRRRIIERLSFLGFCLRGRKNAAARDSREIINVSGRGGVPILVVPTDENTEIARRVQRFLT